MALGSPWHSFTFDKNNVFKKKKKKLQSLFPVKIASQCVAIYLQWF